MFRGALHVVGVTGRLVGEVNRDMAVVGKWTDTEDIAIRYYQARGDNYVNIESAVLSWGIPNFLFNDQVIGIEEISIIALRIIRSALLKYAVR
jgi:hypothetical protein